MYKGFQEVLFKNDWGVNSGFKTLADKLNDLLPIQGACANARSTNKNLDKFRRAQNASYDSVSYTHLTLPTMDHV